MVVASSFGSRSHPDWYHNLLVNPLLEVETPVGRGKCRARLLQGEEYDFWWERITTYYPGYLRYQQWAGPRKVPLISLEPLPGREDT